jgi:GcrA cell cycle regulator
MGQLVPGWTQEQSEALKSLIADRLSLAEAAKIINERFGTNYTRNAAVGKAHRLGIVFPVREKKPPYVRKTQRPIVRIVRANGNSDAMRRITSSEAIEIKLRCVEIVPRNLSLIELEACDCRYPTSDDAPFLFCGHPKQAGSSYCTPHHFLCWEPARKMTEQYLARAAA